MKVIASIFLFLTIGCGGYKSKSGGRILDFGSFTIEAPNNWTKVKVQGIDSYVGRIAIGNTDTLEFDLGPYSNSLNENDDDQVSWAIIDGRKSKIVKQSKSGVGITGIYIDSLWKNDWDVIRFNLYGMNLHPDNQRLLLKTIQTLKFFNKR